MGLEKELVWSKHLISLHLHDTDWTLLRWQRMLLLTAKIYPSYQLSSLIWCDDVDLFSADVFLLCDQWEQKVVCGSYALDVADARDDISWWEFVSLTGSRSIQRTSGFLSAQILLHRFCTEWQSTPKPLPKKPLRDFEPVLSNTFTLCHFWKMEPRRPLWKLLVLRLARCEKW